MDVAELAVQLANVTSTEQHALLEKYAAMLDTPLAYALKEECYRAWASEPARAVRAATALAELARRNPNAEIRALAAWTAGIAALTQGQMENAIAQLDQAEAGFTQLNQSHTAASTQVSKLYALAMLGHYDEAITCGTRARDVFAAHGDDSAAGKIEQNLANIEFRRGRFPEAEVLYRAALGRFEKAQDFNLALISENGLGNVLTQRHSFQEARLLFERALERAQKHTLTAHQAALECNIGSLALFQGQYDRALDYLERSRRRFAALGMPHESAEIDAEIADAYLELNLVREAGELYAQVLPTFAELGMQAERAHGLMQAGRAAQLQGQFERAQSLLTQARALFQEEENRVGTARVSLMQAQLALSQNDAAGAEQFAERAETPLLEQGAHGAAMDARWLRGEALRQRGELETARVVLEETLQKARQEHAPQVAQRCLTSLGLLSNQLDFPEAAEAQFRQAIALIEDLRAPLPAEEFRAAFLADKLAPYSEMVRLSLDKGTPEAIAQALDFVERARSRALIEMLGNAVPPRLDANDPTQAALLLRLETLRAELNWFYNQVNRPSDGETTRGAAQLQEMAQAMRAREIELAEITRQVEIRSGDWGAPLRVEPFDLPVLQNALGATRALIEFFALDGQVYAFVVTNETVRVVPRLASEHAVEEALEQFRFQISSLRYGAARLRVHLPQLAERARHYLAQLYDLLLAPLEPLLGERALVIVPYRLLHYVPFHALHDGVEYVIERREVSYAPSAGVLNHLLHRPRRAPRRAVLLGLPDEWTPRVREEVAAIAPLFSQATILNDDAATMEHLRAALPSADVVHLASHGQFRPDNPLFSSIRLHDGWLTVRDAYAMELNCELVTLSACETGVSAVAPGDELIGLARGFFRAGAPSLVVSLWTVDDAATAQLMTEFYSRLTAGDSPAAALRYAQRILAHDNEHPFFWSPFILLGRW